MLLTISITTTIAVLAYLTMGLLSSRSKFEVANRTVIVTGASQGLGLALARQLAAKGAHVVIVAQTVSKLEKALAAVRSAATDGKIQRFMYLSYDLRSPDAAPAILQEVSQWNNGEAPDIVVNCAGHCIPGFFASSSIDTLRGQMETLYWSCAYMAHATVQQWIQPVEKEIQKNYRDRTRHLIFTSSVLAFMPLAGYAPYNPAKAAMRTLADTLNQELEVYNGARSHATEPGPAAEIKVHAIYPVSLRAIGSPVIT